MRILAVSSLLPDAAQPSHGIHNARLIRELASAHDVRLLIARMQRIGQPAPRCWQACSEDTPFSPVFCPIRYVPKIGSYINHRLFAYDLHRALRGVNRSFQPQIVLAPWLYPDACGVQIAAAPLSLPVIPVAQGTDAHQYLDFATRRRAMLKHLGKSPAIATRSADLRNRLIQAGFEAERVQTIYNGVNLSRFSPGPRALSSSTFRLLYVGNFYPIKNPLLPITALESIRQLAPDLDVSLTMIGDGELFEQAKSLIAQADLSNQISLAGRQPPNEVARFMQEADLLLVPSRNEGIPNVLREAFACGTPAVATHVGGIPEVLTENFLGSLVPDNDAQAMAHAILRQHQGGADRARIHMHAQQYSWKQCVDRYTSLFEDALANTAITS